MKNRRSRWVPAVAVTVIALGSGGWLLEQGVGAQESTVYRARLFDEVHRLVAERYVEEMDSSDLYRMAIDGMLAELGDPYSVFIDADQTDDLELSIEGDYGGLGIRIQKVGEWITVMGVIPNSPAERQGLMTGDRIVGVEGESARGWDDTEAVERLRGPKGTPVSISIGRVGASEPLPFTIVRDEIHVETVKSFMVDSRIGFVGLDQFSRDARSELSDAIRELQSQGAEALVLDLRWNPGGLLDQGVAVSDLFLPRGAGIVETRSRVEDQNFTFGAPNDEEFPGLPIVVIVNTASASAFGDPRGSAAGPRPGADLGDPDVWQGIGADRLLASRRQPSQAHDGRLVHAERPVDHAQRDARHGRRPGPRGHGPGISHARRRRRHRRPRGRTTRQAAASCTAEEESPRMWSLPTPRPSTSARSREPSDGPASRSTSWRFASAWNGRTIIPTITPDFVVSPEMREAFFQMISEIDGLEVERELFDRVEGRIDRYLEAQIANSAFGDLEMFRRFEAQSPMYQEAVRLLGEASTPEELLSLAGDRVVPDASDVAHGELAGVGATAHDGGT